MTELLRRTLATGLQRLGYHLPPRVLDCRLHRVFTNRCLGVSEIGKPLPLRTRDRS
jgi:hypothetical protein